jgi:hypothetical protein
MDRRYEISVLEHFDNLLFVCYSEGDVFCDDLIVDTENLNEPSLTHRWLKPKK